MPRSTLSQARTICQCLFEYFCNQTIRGCGGFVGLNKHPVYENVWKQADLKWTVRKTVEPTVDEIELFPNYLVITLHLHPHINCKWQNICLLLSKMCLPSGPFTIPNKKSFENKTKHLKTSIWLYTVNTKVCYINIMVWC